MTDEDDDETNLDKEYISFLEEENEMLRKVLIDKQAEVDFFKQKLKKVQEELEKHKTQTETIVDMSQFTSSNTTNSGSITSYETAVRELVDEYGPISSGFVSGPITTTTYSDPTYFSINTEKEKDDDAEDKEEDT